MPQNASPTDLVSFLEGAGSGQENAECVTLVIDALGNQRYAPAIPVVIKFLDFRRPRTEREKLGLHVHTRGFYPAVNALEQIGDEALPAVLNVIKDPRSDRARENAVSVWMEIHKYKSPEGVALLKREADATNDSAIKERLGWAISKALTRCNPPDQDRCKAAAKTGRTE